MLLVLLHRRTSRAKPRQVPGEVDPATLVGGALEHSAEGGDQTGVLVGDT
jgi:hypothetical protein